MIWFAIIGFAMMMTGHNNMKYHNENHGRYVDAKIWKFWCWLLFSLAGLFVGLYFIELSDL